MNFLKLLFNKLTHLYLLLFLLGFTIASVLYFKMEAKYGDEIFEAISHYIVRDSIGKNNPDTFFVRALNTTNSFEHNRLSVFKNQEIKGWKANIFHPITVDLITGNGACGSASKILARILKANNYQVRFAQMITDNSWGRHIIIEVKKNDKWIVLDPLFNIYFKDSLGNFASFNDVHKNFEYYKKQLPNNYPMEYNYAGVIYTNWNKIKLIGPATKSILNVVIGKQKADEISLRSYALRPYYLCYLLCVAILIVLLGLFGFKLKGNFVPKHPSK